MAQFYKPSKKKSKKIINKEETKEHRKTKNKQSSGGGVYYSFLTIILLLCLVQLTISAVFNISKIVSYKAKIAQIKTTRDAAQALNDQLNDSIKNFSNVAGLEAIARNNLKMSSEDEVMVIINTPKEDDSMDKPKKFSFFN